MNGRFLLRQFLTLTRPSSTKGPHPFVPEEDKVLRKGRKPWRDAASLILAAPGQDGEETHFLVIKRSQGSSTSPNILCFPGGVVSDADTDKKWINFYRCTTDAGLEETVFLKETAAQPFMYKKDKWLPEKGEEVLAWWRDRVPPQIALRIAAVRETFEETGILIVRRNVVEEGAKKLGRDSSLGIGEMAGTYVIKDPNEIEKWQVRVKKNPGEFMTMCEQHFIRPDLNALVEWSNWLTPSSFGVKRFDTLFYMAIVPHPLPVLPDPFEVATVRWTPAEKVLQGAKDGKAKLIPPQIYELTRLRNTKTDRIKQLMRTRLNMGIERWCPCYFKMKDGMISVLPGDDMYPSDLRIDQFEEIRQIPDQTIQDVRTSTKRHHRIEFKSEFDFQLLVNIGPRVGQIYLN